MRKKTNHKLKAQGRVDVPLLARLTLRIPQAVALSGLSRTKLYALIKTGELPSRNIAGCRVIVTDELRRLMTGSAAPTSEK